MDKSDKEGHIVSDDSGPNLPVYTDKDEVIHEGTADEQAKLGFWTRMGCTRESFQRRTAADKHNQLNQTLKSRHLHMIAIGGSIGAGLFVGSGSALTDGGPAALLIDFSIIGIVSREVLMGISSLRYCN